ncbi:hypothetical protein D3C71_1090320 [compost metagenome]
MAISIVQRLLYKTIDAYLCRGGKARRPLVQREFDGDACALLMREDRAFQQVSKAIRFYVWQHQPTTNAPDFRHCVVETGLDFCQGRVAFFGGSSRVGECLAVKS